MLQSRWMARGWLLALVLLAGCAPRPPSPPAASCRILAEFYPLYVMMLNLTDGVPGVEVNNLIPTSAGCPDDYPLTPGDLKKLSQAQIFVVNGAGLENYLDKVASQLPQLRIFDASAGLDALVINGEKNPHLWVSPMCAAQEARHLAVALATADPAHGALYLKNGEAYGARLDALAAQFHAELGAAPIRRIVAFHDSLPYLARDLNLDILAVLEPAPGQNPSARELADVADLVRAAPGPVALITELDSANPAAEVLSRELHQPLYRLDTVTSGPFEPASAKDAYLRAMQNNLATLRTALGVEGDAHAANHS